MTDFSTLDVDGRTFFIGLAESAYREVEHSLREYDSDGGQLLDARLLTAAGGIRRKAKRLAELCATEQAAEMTNAEVALYEAGLLANGISPSSVARPERYRAYDQSLLTGGI
ncbi:hypothetical protein [Mesorhizobium muleiense]|uniref:Uncharacterized protein n=1 Tax=Mesorhizobium muleiense TaxID=1004279 RepID=A0A1G8V3I0_9HYPH|nr:hypothetical protein [Mesorhizobium muleiense]MCF6102448.1 hypothetical protein [Mesorhizobium muleiense]SDJ60686.1 hypothetical protein SAMN05428953_107195 [Mesorhizobium muleiense]